jgi:hypothetical protein
MKRRWQKAANTMIESYKFGSMVIDGEEYRKDVIILSDGSVISPWWRKSGHKLTWEDLKDILGVPPDVLVIGTGNVGMMTPDSALLVALGARGMEVVALPTEAAVSEYNTRAEKGGKVAACFHLAC